MNIAQRTEIRFAEAFLVAAVAAFAVTPTARATAPWEWRPYRVAFVYESTAAATLTETFLTSARAAAEERLQTAYAGAWQIVPSDEADAGDVDKQFLIRLAYERGEYAATVREADMPLKSLGPTVERRSPLRETVTDLIVAAVDEAFRPVLRIDESRSGSATARLRAAELYPAEMHARRWGADTTWLPFTSRLDRDGRVLDTQPIPWTALSTQERRGGEATCTVLSGLANPLGVRRRGRTERYALAAGQASGATRVRFTSRDGRPLAGCRVYVDDGAAAPAEPLLCDSAGAVTIAARDGRAVTLVVTSRYRPLAKLPLIPGLEHETTAAIVGEPELLAAEDRLAAWQTKFYDEFIERRVLLLLAATQVEREDREAAEKLLTRLDEMPKLSARRAELESLGRRLANEAGRAAPTVATMYAEAAAAVAAMDDAADVADLHRAAAKLKSATP